MPTYTTGEGGDMGGSPRMLKVVAVAVPALSAAVYETLRHIWLEPLPHASIGNVVGAMLTGAVAGGISLYLITRIEEAYRDLTEARAREVILSERQRMAAALHDDIAQRLFWALVALDEAQAQEVTPGSPIGARLAELRGALVDLQLCLREAIAALRDVPRTPPDRFWHELMQFLDRLGLKAKAAPSPTAPAPPSEVVDEVLAVVKEALHNVAKHAGTRQVEIYSGHNRRRWWIAVRDRGRGFDPHRTSEGFGLLLMQERAARIGADLSVRTRPGAGTKVVLQLPLTTRKEA